MYGYKKEMPDGPPPGAGVYHLKVHGGLGDIIWLWQTVVNLDRPVFLSISQENRARPRRAGQLIDHFTGLYGWRYDATTFCPNTGQDWPATDDPCCALGKTWADLNVQVDVPFRLECNRHLESGYRLEKWLPDVPKTFHFELDPAPPPAVTFRRPCVVFHIAGWPDIPDAVWGNLIRLFVGFAHVYIVGGSYDYRTRRVYDQVRGTGWVTLLEDVGWGDLFGVLKACDYCFGHASGFTILADVMKVPGVVVNPQTYPRLIGTWNSPDNPNLLHVSGVKAFETTVIEAYKTYSVDNRATWPPTGPIGPKLTADPSVGQAAACRSAGELFAPRSVAVWTENKAPADLASAVISGSYFTGRPLQYICLVDGDPDAVAAVYRESLRCSRRPQLEFTDGWRPDRAHDLVVIYGDGHPARTSEKVRSGWRVVAPNGALLVGGPAAWPAVSSLGQTLRVKPAEVGGMSDWWYIHRRV